jgi:hypothetical protein
MATVTKVKVIPTMHRRISPGILSFIFLAMKPPRNCPEAALGTTARPEQEQGKKQLHIRSDFEC